MTNEFLSPLGQRRRDEILAHVLDEARHLQLWRRRRRRLAKVVPAVALVAAAMWTLSSLWEQEMARPTQGRPVIAEHGPAPPTKFQWERYVAVSKIDRLEAYLVQTRAQYPPGILLSDEQLLGALAGLGRVEGIVRVHGKTWLASELGGSDANTGRGT
jgi:hypothetical protein